MEALNFYSYKTVPLYTNPPAGSQGVPEDVIALVREAEAECGEDNDSLRESWLAQRWLDSLNEVINRLSTSPGNGWVRCEDEWPHTEEVIWVDDNSYPKPTLLDVGFLQMAIDLGRVRHWMPTGLKRPEPPTGESK